MTDHRLYFAYGSNLDLSQMRDRCPDSTCLHPAVLNGYKLVFAGVSHRWGGQGSASIMEAADGEVHGLIYRMPAHDIEVLNGYESVPTVYTQQEIEVRSPQGKPVSAFTYQRVDHRINPPHIGYFHKIWGGYRAFGLRDEHLFRAVTEAITLRQTQGPIDD